jgi:hypothetical protein
MIAATAALEWAWKHWKLIAGGLVLSVLGIMLLLAKADARHWEKVAAQEKAAHAQTVANYRAAADEAKRLDAANVERVRTEQTAITERTIDAYQSKLADSASRYDRLRAQADGYLSRPSAEGVPETRDTTCVAVSGTGCEELPALLKAAQDNTDQLVALQAWNREQAGVDIGNPR